MDRCLFWMLLGGAVGTALAVPVAAFFHLTGLMAPLAGGIGSLAGMHIGGEYGIHREGRHDKERFDRRMAQQEASRPCGHWSCMNFSEWAKHHGPDGDNHRQGRHT